MGSVSQMWSKANAAIHQTMQAIAHMGTLLAMPGGLGKRGFTVCNGGQSEGHTLIRQCGWLPINLF